MSDNKTLSERTLELILSASAKSPVDASDLPNLIVQIGTAIKQVEDLEKSDIPVGSIETVQFSTPNQEKTSAPKRGRPKKSEAKAEEASEGPKLDKENAPKRGRPKKSADKAKSSNSLKVIKSPKPVKAEKSERKAAKEEAKAPAPTPSVSEVDNAPKRGRPPMSEEARRAKQEAEAAKIMEMVDKNPDLLFTTENLKSKKGPMKDSDEWKGVRKPSDPIIPIEKSVLNSTVICLEDGHQGKMLKRHLMTKYGMTPEEYLKKWGLSENYPLSAPDYINLRSKLAEKNFGRKTA